MQLGAVVAADGVSCTNDHRSTVTFRSWPDSQVVCPSGSLLVWSLNVLIKRTSESSTILMAAVTVLKSLQYGEHQNALAHDAVPTVAVAKKRRSSKSHIQCTS